MNQLSTAVLWNQLRAATKADFMVMPDCRISYVDLEHAVRRWMSRFDSAQLQEGDRVLIRTGNEVAAVSGFIAALLDGLVPILLTADTPDFRALALIKTVSAALLVADVDRLPAGLPKEIRTALLSEDAQPARRSWFGAKPTRDWLAGFPAEFATRAPRLPANDSGLAYVLFTSGTTSSPSGVKVTRGNLFANLATLSRLFGYDANSRIFNDMILAHADGMVQGPLLALTNSCSVIRSGGFRIANMEAWLERVRKERATHVITVPTIWAMIDAYARHDDYFDATECQWLISVAAKLPDKLWRALEERFHRPVFNQYGLTETVASALYAGRHSEMGAFGTVGLPVDCEARIDPLCATPLTGELHLRGDNVFRGYWNDAQRTRATFTDDGWMRTGDLARKHADGSYEILGRLKSVIMMGGFLIRPDEIDEAILLHPQVRESVTVGISDTMFDEVPVTAVVCDGLIDENGLTTHARATLESQKVPKRIFVLDSIPRGDSGKARLAALRDTLLGMMGEGAGPVDQDASIEQAVIAVAANMFRIDPSRLTVHSGPGSVVGWDSFSQLNFLMAVEQRFDVAVPASRVAVIETIGDMVETVKELTR